LFGDTVNTTARVETLGAKNKIHVSQEFADEIVKHNKQHWLVPREDMVQAKGKGLLKTYWLQMQSAHSYGSTRSRLSSTGSGSRRPSNLPRSHQPTTAQQTSAGTCMQADGTETQVDESETSFRVDNNAEASFHVDYDTLVEC